MLPNQRGLTISEHPCLLPRIAEVTERVLLVLVRHTRADVADGICYGRLDLSADPGADGLLIAAAVKACAPATIWSSPARRCRGLAEIIAGETEAPLVTDSRLEELDFGAWEGMRWDDVPRAELNSWAANVMGFAPPGGETGAALVARASSFFVDLASADGPHVVVSHAGPLRVLAALARGEAIDLLRPGPALGSVQQFSVAVPLREGRGQHTR